MKTIVIKNMKNFSLVAIMMAAIVFAACSGEEYIISTQPTTGTFTLTVNASKGDDSATRALSLDGDALKATWKEGDVVTVYNVTRSAELTGSLIAQDNDISTKLRGTLTGTIAAGDELKLKFLSPTYTSQDGTLAGIAATCDYAEATVIVSPISGSSITTSDATFTNQQSIVEFTLKDKATDAELNATSLTVNAGATTINVTPASATNVIYVAIPGISSQNVSLSAIADGTIYTYEKTSVTLTNSKFYGYTVSMTENPLAQPLTFEAKEAGAIVTFTAGTAVTTPIEYSIDGITWTTYSSAIVLSKIGDKVFFRGDNEAYGASGSCSHFRCSKYCYVYGNIMSLINPTNFAIATELTAPYTFAYLLDETYIKSHSTKKLILPATTLTKKCYYAMFNGCGMSVAPELPATTLAESCYERMFDGSHLSIAPELPATTLVKSCYEGMFYSCLGLTTVPDLPATTLAERCCIDMFNNCRGLIVAPGLAATTLVEGCYRNMFSGCTSLTTAPALPATTLAEYCYQLMFCGCTSLTTAPVLPATTLEYSCYSNMFYGCTSLTTAPELPATTLAQGCYEGMFCGCTSLTTAPELPATTLAHSCYSSMFSGCTSLTTAPKLPATTLKPVCYQSMFRGCTSLTTAPDLLATTLESNCYETMFYGCTSLNKVKCLATSIFSMRSTNYWLEGVSSTGTFTKATGVDWSGKTGSSGIPSGWTVVEQ